MEDAAFIVWLRNLDYVKGRVGDSATDVAGQKAWLEKYFAREGDYYFIAETLGEIPLGTQGIYDVRGTSGEKGRVVMRPEILAGLLAGILTTDLAFETLGMTELTSTVVSTNREVLSIHRKTGFKQVGILRAGQVIGGKPVDLVQYHITAEEWFKARDNLLPMACFAETLVRDWEKKQLGRTQPWDELKM